MKTIISTWGIWEDARVLLKKTLLNEHLVTLDDEKLDEFLLGEDFLKILIEEPPTTKQKNTPLFFEPSKEKIMKHFVNHCLTLIKQSLQRSLSLSDEQINLYGNPPEK